MNISEAARASGVSAKMIRHYEGMQLIPPAARSAAGYRHYSERDVHLLSFIRSARDLGFSLERIRELLSLWQNRDRTSREVKALAQAHILELEAKVADLNRMIASLNTLMVHCHGDHRPDCPILDGLSKSDAVIVSPSHKQSHRTQKTAC